MVWKHTCCLCFPHPVAKLLNFSPPHSCPQYYALPFVVNPRRSQIPRQISKSTRSQTAYAKSWQETNYRYAEATIHADRIPSTQKLSESALNPPKQNPRRSQIPDTEPDPLKPSVTAALKPRESPIFQLFGVCCRQLNRGLDERVADTV